LPATPGAEPVTIAPETLSAHRDSQPARLRRALRGDLDNIVIKALQKDEARRYATAAELGDDIGRFLEGLPVHAQPDRRMYRMAKFVRRHRVATAALGAAVVALVTGTGLALWQAERARTERDRARLEAAKANEVSAFLRSLFDGADPRRTQGRKLSAEELLDSGAQRVDTELAGQPEVQAAMLAHLGSIYYQLSLHRKAVPLLERSLALREQSLSPTHSDVAQSVYLLGRSRSALGEYAAAQPLLERAVSLWELHPQGHDADLALALSQLGMNHWRQGHLEPARALLARAVALSETGDPRRLRGQLTNLATIDIGLDDLERAHGSFERALKINDAVGDGDAGVTVTLYNLGNLLYDQEDYAQARALIERALAADEKVYGNDAQGVVYGVGEMGYVYFLLGDHARGRVFIERSIATGERLLGPDHRELAPPLTYLGRLHLAEGRPREALALFERVLRQREARLGPDHVEVSESLIDIAAAQLALRGPAAAEPFLRRALEIQRAAARPGHRVLVPTLTALGRVLLQQGHATEARPLLEEAVTIARAKLAPVHSKRRAAESALRDATVASR
jgi:serine/threonine-protein kinase